MTARVIRAARDLRRAQRAYLADRGNDRLGRAVAEAARRLDEALAEPEAQLCPRPRRGGQSRRASAVEAVTNILIGCGVSAIGNALFLPLVGLPAPSVGQHVALAALFTALSLARSYWLRRLFNRFGG